MKKLVIDKKKDIVKSEEMTAEKTGETVSFIVSWYLVAVFSICLVIFVVIVFVFPKVGFSDISALFSGNFEKSISAFHTQKATNSKNSAILGVNDFANLGNGKDTANLRSYLFEDIFIVQNQSTLAINSAVLKGFVKECRVESSSNLEINEDIAQKEEDSFDCVDVVAVREFVYSRQLIIDRTSKEKSFVQNRRGSFYYYESDLAIDIESVVSDIVEILTRRIAVVTEYDLSGNDVELLEAISGEITGIEVVNSQKAILERDYAEDFVKQFNSLRRTVDVKYRYIASTDGTYANKYIEIDHSQQRLYAWEDGEVLYEWAVSGVLDEYAVFGVFEVGEKSPQAWSPIVSKWMPYWMSYYYDPVGEAWFGIHGLVWWEDGGTRYYETEDSIGNKKSGGCVRLTVENAKILYNWAETGMPVLIHE